MLKTEVEQIKALREAFLAGRRMGRCMSGSDSCQRCERQAADRYPMPTVEVPRVVRLSNGIDYRFVSGRLESKAPISVGWLPSWDYARVNDVLALAELVGNPTEQKPADQVEP